MSPIEVGTPAPDVHFRGDGDREIALGELWRERTTVLVFLRHFG